MVRLVPDQTPDAVDPLVIKYVTDEFTKLGSKNKMTIENLHGGKPWVADTNHWNYQAAKIATKVRQTKLEYVTFNEDLLTYISAVFFLLGNIWRIPGFDT